MTLFEYSPAKMKWRVFIVFIISLLFCVNTFAQNTTINTKGSNEMLTSKDVMRKHKVLIIPFEPKMYMSEIDKKVNKETSLPGVKIHEAFREGLDEMLYISIKQKTSVYSYLNDSAGSAKDMAYTYASISYHYEPIPPEDATEKELNEKKKVKEEPKIVNGQLVVKPSTQKKFMNTHVNDEKLLSYLKQKYGNTVFVFINELDIRNNPESYDIQTDTYMRDVTIHYSVLDQDGKYLAYGVATTSFPSTINDPTIITNKYFSQATKQIADKLEYSLLPDELKKQMDNSKGSKPKFR